MTQPFRTRRIRKWAGVGVCGMIVIAWALSADFQVTVAYGEWAVGLYGGGFKVNRGLWGNSTGFTFVRIQHPSPLGLYLPYQIDIHVPQLDPAYVVTETWIPFWLILLPFLILTVRMFLQDRRRIPPGHCQHCSFNLKCNTSGICPGCGTPIPEETREKLKAETQKG